MEAAGVPPGFQLVMITDVLTTLLNNHLASRGIALHTASGPLEGIDEAYALRELVDLFVETLVTLPATRTREIPREDLERLCEHTR